LHAASGGAARLDAQQNCLEVEQARLQRELDVTKEKLTRAPGESVNHGLQFIRAGARRTSRFVMRNIHPNARAKTFA
jgi:hypothetical protein